MTNSPNYNDVPRDVTFFIGPIGTPVGKKAYEIAVQLADQGDRIALDEFLEIRNEALRTLAGHSPEEPSPLKELLSAILGQQLGPVSTFVGTGFIKRVWTPTLTIHLDRSKGADGTPLGHIFQKDDGEVIAAYLGRGFEADWIYTSWAYFPAEPFDLNQCGQETAAEEIQ